MVLAYSLVLSAGPFLHHDFACHQSSRTHCTSCQVSQSAQKEEANAASLTGVLSPSGQLEPHAVCAIDVLTPPRITGRSPPV